MNKKFIAAAAVLIAGSGLAWFLLNQYLTHEDSLAPWTEKELGKAGRRQKEPPEAALAPVAPTNVVRLAIGDFGSANQPAGTLGDLLTAELSGAKGLELVERQTLAAVLREHELSFSSIVRAKDAMQIGKLVRADWFLLGKPYPMGGTNLMVLRIVDVPTGIMRDITVLPTGDNVARTASAAATFVRQSREAATNFTPRVFLAIGGFADVGVNARQTTFPGQLRAYLVNAYQNSTVTLLERELVSSLLQEIELDLAGLAESHTGNAPPPLRSTFWLVDGYFQSFENTGFEVELRLQVKRAFGGASRFTFRGAPEAVLPQAKTALDQTLAAADPRVPGPTRRDEIEKQLQMGKDLLVAAWGTTTGLAAQNPKRDVNEPRRRHNIEEAQHAFETVLLLEHDNPEAAFYLGACLADWTLDRELDALPYLRAAADSKRTPPHIAKQAVSMIERIEYLHSLGRWRNRQENMGSTEPKDPEQLLASVLRKVDDLWKKEHTWGGVYLGDFVNAYGTNSDKAAKALTQLWPKVKPQYPELSPYILARILSSQTDTNSPIVAEFHQSLGGWAEHPEEVFQCGHFFYGLTHTEYEWCMRKRMFPLAMEILEAKRRASQHSTKVSFERRDIIRLGFALAALNRWGEALTAFEQVGDAPVDMEWAGPWGSPVKPFLPGHAAAACREKLGLPAVRNPAHFAFGSPCACMHSRSAFAATDDALWLAIGGQLIRLGLDLHTNLQVSLPVGDSAPVTALCVGREHIWMGTAGAGLIDYEKTTGKFRQIAEKDGLLLNNIASLWPQEQTLWLGFGDTQGITVDNLGGLGRMDILTARLTSFTPSLPATPISRVTLDLSKSSDPSNGPPSHTVAQLGSGVPGDIWMLVHWYGLRRYRSADNSWSPVPDPTDAELQCFTCDGERLVAGLSIERIMVTLETRRTPGGDTNLVVRTNVLMTASELERFRVQNNSPYVACSTAKDPRNTLGAIGIYNSREGRWNVLLPDGGLPRPVDRIALDGKDIWVAGSGYVAVVDPTKPAIRKICYLPVNEVDRIQIAGGYLWAQFDRHLYRVALSEVR